MTTKKALFLGSLAGIIAWAAYGLVEYAFFTIGCLLTTHDAMVTLWHYRLSLQLFTLYVIIGAVVGGVCGILLNRRNGQSSQIDFERLALRGATSAVALAFVINNLIRLTHFPFSLPDIVALITGGLLYFLLGLSLRINSRLGRNPFLRGPWTASVILVGAPWLIDNLNQNYFHFVQILLFLVGVALILDTASLATLRLRIRRQATIQGVTAFAILVLIVLLNPSRPSPSTLDVKQTPASTGPNIILIVMDTIRADHMSLYGYTQNTTPHLNALSRESTLVTRAIAASDVTLPAHATMFTGLYPAQHGVHCTRDTDYVGRPLDGTILTLTEFLNAHGYSTVGISANCDYVNSGFGFDRGFQIFQEHRQLTFDVGYYSTRTFLRVLLHAISSTIEFDRRYITAEEINKYAFDILSNTSQDISPFFLFLNYMDAHAPYIPPAPFDTVFPGKSSKDSHGLYRKMKSDVMSLRGSISPELRRHYVSQYDGGIAYIDFQIGRLIDHLKDLGLYDNSLIIITSDHGEAFGDKDNLVEHGVSVYQDVVHVPLLIKLPYSRQQVVIDSTVSQADLLPTILEVLQLDWPAPLPGASIFTSGFSPQAYSEYYACYFVIDEHPRFDRKQWAVLSEEHKLVISSNKSPELYDLLHDPTELRNIYVQEESRAVALENKLLGWQEYVRRTRVIRQKIDPEQLQRLKSLGYVH